MTIQKTTKVKRNEKYGFYQLNPIPRPDELSEFYESQYYDLIRRGGRAPEIRRLMEGGEAAETERAWLRETLYTDLVDQLDTLIQGNQILDVGAGTGDFVAFLNARGLIASGIEPSSEAAAIAQDRGLAVSKADLEQWVSEPNNCGRYDAIVLLNVLEHVPDPEATLRRVRKLLKPQGIVCIRVPNDFSEIQRAAVSALGRDPWWVCAPDHINYFSVETLSLFLDALGFDCVRVTADFPMELFLLMGDDYTGSPDLGRQAHQRRQRFELALPAPLRQRIYTALATVGVGRNTLAFGRLRA